MEKLNLNEIKKEVEMNFENREEGTMFSCYSKWTKVGELHGSTLSVRKAVFGNCEPSYGFNIEFGGTHIEHRFESVEEAIKAGIEKIEKDELEFKIQMEKHEQSKKTI